jgi:hypothetical protein
MGLGTARNFEKPRPSKYIREIEMGLGLRDILKFRGLVALVNLSGTSKWGLDCAKF